MKLKHHLWIAFGIIIIALFLTAVVSTTIEPLLFIDKESTTTIWDLMWENLFTSIPTDNAVATLVEGGVPEPMALDMVEEHGTGNSLLSGLLGLIPILATLAGVLLVTFKENIKKWVLYGLFGLVFVSAWTIWFTAPTKLTGVESLYNTMHTLNPLLPTTMGTMMSDATEFTMGLGFFVILLGSLYGIVALVLNKYGKIEE